MISCYKLFRGSVSNVVVSCICKFPIAYLLHDCVMVRDGLAKFPDCFTAGDMSDIVSYLSKCLLFSVSLFHSFLFLSLYLYLVYDTTISI